MNLKYFKKLAAETGGMLSPRVYRKYYKIAKLYSEGAVLELGTGQGAGTIAFALGIRDAGRCSKVLAVDQFYQKNDRGPHPAGTAMHGDEAVRINAKSFRENLSKHGVEEFVDVYVGKTDEVEIDFSTIPRCDVLVIDIDGMIDRDLAIYYDIIPKGGLIIIDDYKKYVNRHGLQALKRYGELDRQSLHGYLDKLPSYDRRRLLGKHMLTYRLVNLIKGLGLVEPFNLMGATLFLRKTGTSSFADRVGKSDIEVVEQSICRDFEAMVAGRIRKPLGVRPFLGDLKRRSLGAWKSQRG